jgi:hypothetical protein
VSDTSQPLLDAAEQLENPTIHGAETYPEALSAAVRRTSRRTDAVAKAAQAARPQSIGCRPSAG